MAKALKIASIGAAVIGLAIVTGGAGLFAAGIGSSLAGGIGAASALAGVSASTMFFVSAGLMGASGLLQKTPRVPSSQTDRLTAKVEPGAYRKTVLGQTALSMDVVAA